MSKTMEMKGENPQEMKKLSEAVDELKSMVSKMYMPTHFDKVMQKVGSMEDHLRTARRSMNHCYQTVFFIFLLFTMFVAGVIYIMWRLNYFKFLLRQNLFGRFKRPARCYACYRPWRMRQRRRFEHIKPHLSSPELHNEQVISREVRREEYTAVEESGSES